MVSDAMSVILRWKRICLENCVQNDAFVTPFLAAENLCKQSYAAEITFVSIAQSPS
jgi:hypothetical protein